MYLDIYFVRSSKLKCSLDHAKRSFYRSVNSIFGKLGRTASEEVTVHLVHSKCLPALLYGLEVCPSTRIDYRSLNFVLMRFLMKLFCTSNSDIVNECRMCFNFRLRSEIVPIRSVKLMLKLSNVA